MRDEAGPLRPLRVCDVATEDVLAVLRPLWTEKPETARRVRGRIEKILDAGKVMGLRTGDNPARWRGHLAFLLPRRPALSKGSHAALPYDDLPDFMKALRANLHASARALELTILTAVRTDATRFAHAREFDFLRGEWCIPAERLKRLNKAFRVALCPRAIEIVKARIEETGGGYLFPGQRRGRHQAKTISNMAMSNLLPHLGYPNITVHGFRSTFKDWAADCTSFPDELSELALAHTVSDAVWRAYRRGDGFKMRQALMNAWQRFADGQSSADVVSISEAMQYTA